MLVLATLIFTICSPLCGLYAAVGLIKDSYRWKKYFPFFVLTVFMFSYSYIPPYEMDLTRYFDMVRDIAKAENFMDVISYQDDGLIVRNIVFWIIGKTEDVYLLPAISNSIVYGIAGYITCDTASEYNVQKQIPIYLLFQLSLMPFFSIISNVRNVCAFSLIILASYLDIIKEKRSMGVLLLYILPCFIHTSGIIVLLFRVVSKIAMRFKSAFIYIAVALPMIINLLYNIITGLSIGGSIGRVLNTIVVKGRNYSNFDDRGLSTYEQNLLVSSYAKVQRLYMMGFAVLMIIIILIIAKKFLNLSSKREVFNAFLFLICIMTIACWIFVAPHYWRFYTAAVIMCSSVLIPMLINKNNWSKPLKVISYGLPFFLAGGIAMNMRELVLSSAFPEWPIRFITTNIYFVLAKGLFKLFT